MSKSSRTVARPKRVQYAALPYRPTAASGTEVMLVTSRGRQRWIIPKGWPHSGRAPCDSAAREAFEEAGVLGLVGRRSLGSFRYKKRLKKGRVAVYDVHVFPLNVARQRPQWPEKNQREIKWVLVKDAAETVQNARLREIIRRWAQKIAASKWRARAAAPTRKTPRYSSSPARARPRRTQRFLFEHDLFRRPLHTFRDHALALRRLERWHCDPSAIQRDDQFDPAADASAVPSSTGAEGWRRPLMPVATLTRRVKSQ